MFMKTFFIFLLMPLLLFQYTGAAGQSGDISCLDDGTLKLFDNPLVNSSSVYAAVLRFYPEKVFLPSGSRTGYAVFGRAANDSLSLRQTGIPTYDRDSMLDSIFTLPLHKRYLLAGSRDACVQVGNPVCYIDECGDTIVPFGKYLFCQTDTIQTIGFAYENKPDGRIVCLDYRGNQLFYVFAYDGGPDYVREGLFRIMDERGLIGFADESGKVVISPQYRFAFPFENGKAKVTLSGHGSSSDEEHSVWKSDEWFYIDRKNNKLKLK